MIDSTGGREALTHNVNQPYVALKSNLFVRLALAVPRSPPSVQRTKAVYHHPSK